MKKVVLVLATTLTLLSCEKEIIKPATDFNCDRVAKVEYTSGVKLVSLTGTFYQYGSIYNIYTVNDCTHLNQTFQVVGEKNLPKVGECFKKSSY